MEKPVIIQSTDNIEQDLQRALAHHASRLAKQSETEDHYFNLVTLAKSYKILRETKTNPLDNISESQLQELFIDAVELLPLETKQRIMELLLKDPDLRLINRGNRAYEQYLTT